MQFFYKPVIQGESGGTGDEKMSDLKLQEELAGDDVLLKFVIQGKPDIIH